MDNMRTPKILPEKGEDSGFSQLFLEIFSNVQMTDEFLLILLFFCIVVCRYQQVQYNIFYHFYAAIATPPIQDTKHLPLLTHSSSTFAKKFSLWIWLSSERALFRWHSFNERSSSIYNLKIHKKISWQAERMK